MFQSLDHSILTGQTTFPWKVIRWRCIKQVYITYTDKFIISTWTLKGSTTAASSRSTMSPSVFFKKGWTAVLTLATCIPEEWCRWRLVTGSVWSLRQKFTSTWIRESRSSGHFGLGSDATSAGIISVRWVEMSPKTTNNRERQLKTSWSFQEPCAAEFACHVCVLTSRAEHK